MRNGYLPPGGDAAQKVSVLEYKVRQLQAQNDALQTTVDGLTQFICAAADENEGELYVRHAAMNHTYKSNWGKDEFAIWVETERVD